MTELAPYFLLIAGIVTLLMLLLRIPPIHPLSLTIIPQLILISYTCTNLQYHLPIFGILTWLILFGSMLAFVLGSIVASALTRSWKPFSHPQVLSKDPWAALVFPFTLFALSILWGAFRLGALPIFSSHPDLLRAKFISSIIQGAMFSLIIPVMAFSMLGLRRETTKKFKVASVVISATSLLMYFSTANRGLVLMFVIMFLVFFDILIARLRPRHFALATIIFTVVFFGGGYLRYGNAINYSNSHGVKYIVNFFLGNTYAYSGNGFWNLDFALNKMALEKLNIPTYGSSIFEGFLASFNLFQPLNNAFGWDGAMNHEVIRIRGLNSTTFHWALIKDFGIVAPFLWSFVIGMILSATDKYCRFHKSIKLTLVQCQFSYYTFIGFNIFPFSVPITVIGTISTIILAKSLSLKIPNNRLTEL